LFFLEETNELNNDKHTQEKRRKQQRQGTARALEILHKKASKDKENNEKKEHTQQQNSIRELKLDLVPLFFLLSLTPPPFFHFPLPLCP
jgi:hypothetical protein